MELTSSLKGRAEIVCAGRVVELLRPLLLCFISFGVSIPLVRLLVLTSFG